MTILNKDELAKEFAKITGSWCVYICYDHAIDYGAEEITKAALYLSETDVLNNKQFIFCKSEEEAYRYFNWTVGDDGPTKLNNYVGPVRIYAHVVNPQGEIETKNT